jgi:hypothetical protein
MFFQDPRVPLLCLGHLVSPASCLFLVRAWALLTGQERSLWDISGALITLQTVIC